MSRARAENGSEPSADGAAPIGAPLAASPSFGFADAVRAVGEATSDMPRLTRVYGHVRSVSATRLTTDLGSLPVGEVCRVSEPQGRTIDAQVVAIEDGEAVLAPLESVEGLSPDAEVTPLGHAFSVPVGNALLGRVVDGLGRPIDGRELARDGMALVPVEGRAVSPMDRPVVDEVFTTGVSAIDGAATLGIGQRVCLLGAAGAGKTSLLAQLARHVGDRAGPPHTRPARVAGAAEGSSGQARVQGADVCILALIGERGREIREFLDRQLPAGLRERCVVVVSTSERPAMERLMAGKVAATIAEHFRDQGRNVLMLFDSMTRYARAIREVALAAGEPAVRRGYTPSVYAELPRLVERSGRSPRGSITTLFSVLVENEGANDPIAEEVMSLTDGHLVLSSKLARAGHYPAIDILASRSRLMSEIVPEQHRAAADRMRGLLAKYDEIELLLQVGEYKPGHDADADEAVQKRAEILDLLRQPSGERTPFVRTVEAMRSIIDAPVEAVSDPSGGGAFDDPSFAGAPPGEPMMAEAMPMPPGAGGG